ncbi:hypothetical protein GQ600_14082 [Phytophthora cactorum]|nr:hypothetical protein GQ600_14082 [Phytophthora cactorum]
MNTAFGEQLVIADEQLAELAVYHDEARLAQEAEDLRLAIRLSGQQDADAADEDEVVNRAITNSFDEHDAFVAEKDERRRREVIHEYCAQQTVDTAPNLRERFEHQRACTSRHLVHCETAGLRYYRNVERAVALAEGAAVLETQTARSVFTRWSTQGPWNAITSFVQMHQPLAQHEQDLPDQARRLGIPFTSFRNVKARIAATTNQSVQSSTEAVFSATNVVVTDAAVPSADAAVGTIDVCRSRADSRVLLRCGRGGETRGLLNKLRGSTVSAVCSAYYALTDTEFCSEMIRLHQLGEFVQVIIDKEWQGAAKSA